MLMIKYFIDKLSLVPHYIPIIVLLAVRFFPVSFSHGVEDTVSEVRFEFNVVVVIGVMVFLDVFSKPLGHLN